MRIPAFAVDRTELVLLELGLLMRDKAIPLGLTSALMLSDRQQLARAYEQLSPDSRYHRFLTGVTHLSDAMLARLVDGVDGVDHVALVLFLLDEHGVGTPAGVCRLIRYPDERTVAAWQ